jgi:serine protease
MNTLIKASATLCFFISTLVGCGSGNGGDPDSQNIGSRQTSASNSPSLFALATPFQPALVPSIYRFAKFSSGAYFYTGSVEEATHITQNLPDFRYEGAVFEQDTGGSGQPVFRFANLNNGGYFYTGSAVERDATIRNYPNMRFEGTTFSVAGASTPSKPVYRLANLNNGAYLYTSSAEERDYAISLGFWRFEGTTFSVPIPSGPTDPFKPPSPPGVAPVSYSVSGTVSVLETAAVDSDTNDPNAKSYLSNDDFSLAQTITNPVILIGHLTLQYEGPPGPNYDAGDLSDVYRVKLKAGQVIELDFSADPDTFDIDLFVYNTSGRLLGSSIGTNRYECIRISNDGDYFVKAEVYESTSYNDSVYQLRISTPGTGGNCSEVTSANSNIIPKQIIAAPVISTIKKSGNEAVTKALSLTPAERLIAGNGTGERASLFTLPETSSQRTATLKALQAAPKSNGRALKTAGYAALSDPLLDPSSREVLETIVHAKAMMASGRYAYAFPNTRVYSTQTTPLIGSYPTNDREYSRQRWHYEMISMPAAMQALIGMPVQPTQRPIVAVVDTGVVLDHPDLQANLIGGYDFVSNVSNAGDGNGIDGNPDDSARPASNPSFHGTHVAGTIAAQTFNNSGGASVAPMALIMPLRVLGESGGSLYDIMQAIRFAARLPNDSNTLPPRRADVINLSLGGSGACAPQVAQLFSEVRSAGSVLVIATGNDSERDSLAPVGSPANCAGAIAVGAVDATRKRSFFSNGGPEIAIVAPGGDVTVSTTGNGEPDGIFSTVASYQNGVRTPTFTQMMGTSMATPHAAGMIALMRWVNPNISVGTIESLIRSGALTEDLGPRGVDVEFGYGLLNAKLAVDAAIASLTSGPTPGTPVNPPPPAPGKVEASPISISLGSLRSDAELVVQRIGATTEYVASVSASGAAISVAPKAGQVDSNKLGVYIVTANRNALAIGQSSFLSVDILTSTGRTIKVPVNIERRSGNSVGNFGPLYVLALDADQDQLVLYATALVTEAVNGVYQYTIQLDRPVGGRAPQKIMIFAGSDLDNDNAICTRGEACGAFPILSNQVQIIEPRSAAVTGIDFAISPYGGINAAALRASNPDRSGGFRMKKPVAPVDQNSKTGSTTNTGPVK